ncbi:MAG: chitinase [Candidatus Azotimanducaceae bacterium]|jgi:chitinase
MEKKNIKRHRLSLARLLLATLLVGGFGVFAVMTVWRSAIDIYVYSQGTGPTWVAPYVDITSKPEVYFESEAGSLLKNIVIGSIVSSRLDPKKPTWGSHYDLDAAARALDLDRRLVRFREEGGTAIVSFGGNATNEMASANSSANDLAAAYQAVISRYKSETLDFNLNKAVLADAAATERRVSALQSLQRDNPNIQVWLSLPVSAEGLTAGGITMIESALLAGVELAGVNVKTMDYGLSRSRDLPLWDLTRRSLMATKEQLMAIYRASGQSKDDLELWGMMGVTPMIGENQMARETFTLKTANALIDFLREHQIGRISFLTVNRDRPCGVGDGIKQASGTCSGIDQVKYQFAKLFIDRFPASLSITAESSQQEFASSVGPALNHAELYPYPLWRQQTVYDETEKVVWQGRVYKAKWETRGGQPDAPVLESWDSPWLYLGPVLESDRKAVQLANANSSDRIKWTPDRVFLADDEAVHNDMMYRARWWTQGDAPAYGSERAYDHPWEFLGAVNCEGRSCSQSGRSASLLVNYGGLSGVNLEIREDDDGIQGSGNLVQSHAIQSGQKTYSLWKGSYDLVFKVGSSELILDSVDCESRSCAAGNITSTLTVDYEGLTDISMALHQADAVMETTGEMIDIRAAQSGQKTYKVLRGHYDLVFEMGPSRFIVDSLDCTNGNCSPGDIAATLSVDFENLEDISMEIRVADGRADSSGPMVQLFTAQSGHKTYNVFFSQYDLIFKKGASELIRDAVDCRSIDCDAGKIAADLTVDLGEVAASVEIRVDDGQKGSTGGLVEIYPSQSGAKRYSVLRGIYDVSMKDHDWTIVEDAIDCSDKTCRLGRTSRLHNVQIVKLEKELAVLRQQYMPSHPDYITLLTRIEELRENN